MLRLAEPSDFGMTFLDCYVRNKYDSDLVRHCVLGLLVLQLRLSLHNYTPATDELVSWPKIQNRNMHYFAFFFFFRTCLRNRRTIFILTI